MLAYIRGTLEMKMSGYVVIDVGGLGYKLYMSDKGIDNLGNIGEETKVGHIDRNLANSPALSGQNELDEMKNIYDLEGNLGEWITEVISTDHRALRGNSYYNVNIGNFYPANYRLVAHPSQSGINTSSRSTLYL